MAVIIRASGTQHRGSRAIQIHMYEHTFNEHTYIPKGSNVVLFWVRYGFLVSDSMLPKTELHGVLHRRVWVDTCMKPPHFLVVAACSYAGDLGKGHQTKEVLPHCRLTLRFSMAQQHPKPSSVREDSSKIEGPVFEDISNRITALKNRHVGPQFTDTALYISNLMLWGKCV